MLISITLSLPLNLSSIFGWWCWWWCCAYPVCNKRSPHFTWNTAATPTERELTRKKSASVVPFNSTISVCCAVLWVRAFSHIIFDKFFKSFSYDFHRFFCCFSPFCSLPFLSYKIDKTVCVWVSVCAITSQIIHNFLFWFALAWVNLNAIWFNI